MAIGVAIGIPFIQQQIATAVSSTFYRITDAGDIRATADGDRRVYT